MANRVLHKNLITKGSRSGLDIIDKIFFIPLFLSFWNNAQYSDWLLLLSIIAIFSFPEIGVNQFVANRIGLYYDNSKMVASLTKSAKCAIVTIQILLIVVTIILFQLVGIKELGFNHYPKTQLFILLFAFWFNALALQMGNTYVAFYKAENMLFEATREDIIVRLAELLVIFIYVALSLSELFFLTLFPTPRLIILFRRKRKFNTYNPNVNGRQVLVLLRDSTKYSIYNIAPILQNALTSSAVARLFGDVQLVIFITAKSIYGTIRLIAAIISGSYWPFFTNSIRLRRMRDFRIHVKSMTQWVVILVLCSAPLLYLVSPLVYRILDAGPLMSSDISVIVIISACCLALSNSLASILLSVNRYNRVIRFSLVYTGVVSALCFLGTPTLWTFLASILLAEFALLFAVTLELVVFMKGLSYE